jgi:hypothetical protein
MSYGFAMLTETLTTDLLPQVESRHCSSFWPLHPTVKNTAYAPLYDTSVFFNLYDPPPF